MEKPPYPEQAEHELVVIEQNPVDETVEQQPVIIHTQEMNQDQVAIDAKIAEITETFNPSEKTFQETHINEPIKQVETTDTEKKSAFSKWAKKTGLVLAGSLIGLLPMKSEAQSAKNSDKEAAAIEASIKSGEIHELTDQNKTDWNELMDTITVKGLKGSAKLNSRHFSHEIVNEFIKEKEAKNEPTTVSVGMIKSVQWYLKNLQKELNAKEAELELHHGKSIAAGTNAEELKRKWINHEPITPVTFMDELNHTGVDGDLGEFTSQFRFPKSATTVVKLPERIKGTVANMHVDVGVEGSKQTEVKKDEGFMTTAMVDNDAKNAENNK